MSRTECPLCKEPYRMQSVEDEERLVNNPHPKWEVPIEVIEWQPSYTQRVCSTHPIEAFSLLLLPEACLRWQEVFLFCQKPEPWVQGALGMSGGQWSADWQNTNSSKCMHLLQRLISIGAAPHLKPISNGRVGRIWC